MHHSASCTVGFLGSGRWLMCRSAASCSGVGAAGLARVEWGYVLGPRAQTSVALEVVGQWTGCVDDTNRIELDTGTAIALGLALAPARGVAQTLNVGHAR
jgi:hypothetical protein